jgi:hypothetical protein
MIYFLESIRPICLPYPDSIRKKDLVGLKTYVAGWGIGGAGKT